MKVVYATFLVFVLWLIAATSYCNTSHCVLSHTLWNGNANCFHENATSHNLKSKSKTSYLYSSPYWNVSYLNKTCTHLKHSLQISNIKYENSKMLHAWCSNDYCNEPKSKVYVKNRNKSSQYATHMKCIKLKEMCDGRIKKNVAHKSLNIFHINKWGSLNELVYYLPWKYYTSVNFRNHRTLLNEYIDRDACLKILRRQIINVYDKLNGSRLYVTHPNHFFPNINIQVGPQLNLWNGLEFGKKRSNDFNISLHQIHHSLNYCDCHRMSTSSSVAATTRKLFEQNVDSMDTMSNGQKRQVNAIVVSSQKKAKGKGITLPRSPFWLGYHTLNAIAKENGEPMEPTLSVSELVKFGMEHNEALEHLEAVPSFPYIPQEAWPSKRADGKEGGHFNLTQVPFDVEVDEGGFALDYQIAITFEINEQNLATKDEIYAKTEARLKAMGIPLGEILGEPIAILCFHGSRRWSGTIKLHLKNPIKDANDLLYGNRSFILKLDDITFYRGKHSSHSIPLPLQVYYQ